MKKITAVILMIMPLIISGCGYALKSSLPEYIKRIAIPTFINATAQHGIEADLTDVVKKEFLVDGRLEIVDRDKADAILEGTIRKYLVENLSYDVNNVVLQRRIKMVIDIRVIDARTNAVLQEQKEVGGIEGGSTSYFVSDVTGMTIEPEYQARDRIYHNIAGDIVNRVIYGWENY